MRCPTRILTVALLLLACDGPAAGQAEPSGPSPNEAAWAAEPTAAPSEAPRSEPEPPTPASPASSTPYDRKTWQHWIDVRHSNGRGTPRFATIGPADVPTTTSTVESE